MFNQLLSFRGILAVYPWLILILNLILKLIHLTTQPVSLDEPFSIYHSTLPIPALLEQLKAYNNPPLYEILLHFWIRLFNTDPFYVRLLPTLFAAVAPVALFYFCRANFPPFTAVMSSLLLTFSNLLMFYAHDSRVYSLFLLLAIMSMHLYLKLYRDYRRADAVVYVLITTLLLYAHYFGFFVVLIQTIHVIIMRRRFFFRMLPSFSGILLLYAPQILVLLHRALYSVSQGTWVEKPAGTESLYNMIWAFSNAPVPAVTFMALALFASLKYIKHRKKLPVNAPMMLCVIWFLFAWLAMFLISYAVPMYIDRYLIYALPSWCVIVSSSALVLFPGAGARIVSMLVIPLMMIISADPDPDKKQPVRRVISYIRQHQTGGTLVQVNNYDFIPTFAYHYNRNIFLTAHPTREYAVTDSLLKSHGIFHAPLPDTGEVKQLITVRIGEDENHLISTEELQKKGFLEVERVTLPSSWKLIRYKNQLLAE